MTKRNYFALGLWIGIIMGFWVTMFGFNMRAQTHHDWPMKYGTPSPIESYYE